MSTLLKNITFASATVLVTLLGVVSTADAAPRRDGVAGQSNVGPGAGERRVGDRRSSGNDQKFRGNRGTTSRHRNYGGRRAYPGLYIYSSGDGGCGYSYRKWRVTGSRYWRSRYYDCRNG